MIKARVKQGTVSYPVTACSGRADFVQREWRPVPAGCEDEARTHPFLEILEEEAPALPIQEKEPEPDVVLEEEPEEEAPAVEEKPAKPVARKKG